MNRFQVKYSDEQRGALVEAHVAGVRPLARICDLAAAGELTFEGERVPAFEIPNPSARYIVNAAARRLSRASLALCPEESLEALRGRLLGMLDREMARRERELRRGKSDPDQLYRLGRALKELFKLTDELRHEAPPEPGAPDASLADAVLRAGRPVNGQVELNG